MLHTWANRLVKSPKRKQLLLGKKAAPWGAVLRTLQGANLRTACNVSAVFPEIIKLNVKFQPIMVSALDTTIQVDLNDAVSTPSLLYGGALGAANRFGRCAGINLILHNELTGVVFSTLKKDDVIWHKPFLHQTHSVVERLRVNAHHKLVNAETGCVHIYPYAGLFSKEGADTGEPLFFVVNGGDDAHTNVSVFTEAQLREKGISLSSVASGYQLIHTVDDSVELHQSISSLSACVEDGNIEFNLSTVCGVETWQHRYESTNIQRKAGTLNGVLELKRVGVVFKQEG